MKAVVAAFNQEKALVEAFSVITNLRMQLFEALHQVLRRFLGMKGEDRRTMVTLMTGPVLERIRMAQEEARLQDQHDV